MGDRAEGGTRGGLSLSARTLEWSELPLPDLLVVSFTEATGMSPMYSFDPTVSASCKDLAVRYKLYRYSNIENVHF